MSFIDSIYYRNERDRANEGVFGGFNWDYWTEPYNYTVPGKEGQGKEESILAELERLESGDPERYEFLNTNVFRWGKMPVEYSMNELGFDELDFDDEDQLIELNAYLEENFPDIFNQGGQEEEEEEKESYEVTKWEPTELTIEGYTPPAEKELVTSQLQIGNAPDPVYQMKISGTGYNNTNRGQVFNAGKSK